MKYEKKNPVAEADWWKRDLVFDHVAGTVGRKYSNGRFRHDVGHVNGNGYKIIRIDRKMYQLHRLIWQDAYGPIDDGMCVDHIDGNKTNNRLSNLRLVTHKQNMENRHSATKSNRCGVKGVGFSRGKYRARIRTNGRLYELGAFPTIELAQAAYLNAAALLHTHNPSVLKAQA